MDVVTFIQKDIERFSQRSTRITFALAVLVLLVPMGLGLLLREETLPALAPRTLLPNLLAALLSSMLFYKITSKPAAWRSTLAVSGAGCFVILLLATERAYFPSALQTTYESAEAFWRESIRCFSKGGVTTLLLGSIFLSYALMGSSLPTQGMRRVLAAFSGVLGVLMLGFHCDSSSWEHLLVSHIGQAVVFGGVLYGVGQALFRSKLKRAFPKLWARIQKPGRLG